MTVSSDIALQPYQPPISDHRPRIRRIPVSTFIPALLPPCPLTNRGIRKIVASALNPPSALALRLMYTNTLGMSPTSVSQTLSYTHRKVTDNKVSLIFTSKTPVFVGWNHGNVYGCPQVVFLERDKMLAVESLPNISITAHEPGGESSSQLENPMLRINASELTTQEFDLLRKTKRRLFDENEAYTNYQSSSHVAIYFRVHKVVLELPLPGQFDKKSL